MSGIGIILIIIIMLVSMIIAYLGDILGKRIGKKRISIFKLRPRHTAIVITVITGAVIALLTFAVLISLSAPMRRMLLKTEEIYRDMKEAENEKSRLENQARELRRDAEMLSEQFISIQNEKTNIETEVNSLKSEITSLKDEITQRETQLDILAGNQANLESQLSQTGNKLADVNTELEKTKTEKMTVEGAIVALKKNLDNLENDKKTKEEAINKLNKDIDQKNEEIEKYRTAELAFHEGQRLYGFTISNSLSSEEILDAIEKSFGDFKNNKDMNLDCTIQETTPDLLYEKNDVLEKVNNSKASESIILVFAKKNSFKGDQIPVEFLVLDQYIIFKANRLVIEERVEKKLNILEARDLASDLIRRAENQALDLGLLRDPYRQMSKFTSDTLNREADRIENHRRPMHVRLVTTRDIHRSDYLDESNLKFEIIDG